MPSWNQILIELTDCKRIDALDFVRRKYLKKLFVKTNRNIIAYYSGWLQKPNIGNADINDDDKNGFMATIHYKIPLKSIQFSLFFRTFQFGCKYGKLTLSKEANGIVSA